MATLVVVGLGGTSVTAARAALPRLVWSGQSWRRYDGRGALGQVWLPSRVYVQNGALVEVVGGKVAGGVGDESRTFLYGAFAARYEMTRGVGSKYVFLLCAKTASGACRPEIDWAEDPKGDAGRTRVTATLHYGAQNTMIHRETTCRCSQWTTAGVEWQRGLLVFTLNGHVWATIRSSHVPTVAMLLAIQTSQYAGTAPATLTVAHLAIP